MNIIRLIVSVGSMLGASVSNNGLTLQYIHL